jgi:uncharacterized protein YbcI
LAVRETPAGLLIASSNLPGDCRVQAGIEQRDADRVARACAPVDRGRKRDPRLHRERYGTGATTTRTVYQRDHVIVFLEDIYTPLERTLIDADDFEQVKATRQSFQVAMGPEFSHAVTEITGRKVIAFMSQVHLDPGMAAEIFVLEANSAGTDE